MIKDNGGAAFPYTEIRAGTNGDLDYVVFQCGMTMRDWFAGQALQGMLANPEFMQDDNGKRNNTFDNYAKAAYIQADSMLAERGK